MTNYRMDMGIIVCSAIEHFYRIEYDDDIGPRIANADEIAHHIVNAIEAAGYDLVLRQHRDMGPGFTHHDGPDCSCFAAAPKVTE